MKKQGKLGAEVTCLRCGSKMDDFTSKEAGLRPANLDIGVCLYCSAVFQYQIDDRTTPPHITIIEATADVVSDNMDSISNAQLAIKNYRAMKAGKT